MDRRFSLLLFFVICIVLAYLTVLNGKGKEDTLKHETVIQPKIVNVVKTYNAFSKFNRSFPPEKDVNCLSTIPQQLIETSRESPIIIPRKEILQDLREPALACLYHRYLQTLQRHCTSPERIGNLKLGGWYMCTDPEARPRSPCLVYSFSDERDYTSFAYDMATNYKCHVSLYNPRKPSRTFPDNLELFNLKLDTDNGTSVDNLNSELKKKSQNTVNVLTLDINNREWDIIPRLIKSGFLGKTEQLLIRLHSSRRNSTTDHYIKRLVVLRDLYDIGFRIFWSDRDISCLHKTKKVTGCYYINMIRIMNRPSPLVIPSEPEFSKLQPHEYGQLFVRYVTSVQIPCKELIRIGKLADGGWDVCHDAIFRPRESCLVYSFGINNDFSFDDDVANTYGCKVYAFDPSMHKKDHKHSENVMFYNTGISDNNKKRGTWKMRNLITIMEELKQKEKTIDILKMDVERSEWSAIPQMISSGALKHVRQFAFEIHVQKGEDSTPEYKKGLILLRTLYDAGFRIFWAHRNLACQYKTMTGQQRTMCYEVYTANIS